MSSAVQMGRYVVERTLAVGGMSEVLLAHLAGPEGFRRRVVVKRLLPQLADHPDAVELFLNEARIAACFHHPNLITVHELFQTSGYYCLVMELLDGVDVSQIMRRMFDLKRHADPFQAATIIADAAIGLHYAHELNNEKGERESHFDVATSGTPHGSSGPAARPAAKLGSRERAAVRPTAAGRSNDCRSPASRSARVDGDGE
jgi:serine/threonine protein kinase